MYSVAFAAGRTPAPPGHSLRQVPEPREPDPFLDTFTGLVAARAVTSATMLGVFDALQDSPASADELAERLGLDALGADTLLTTLLTLGYVEADGERFRNADVSARLLVRDSPESIATFVGDQGDLHWQVLDLLPDALRTGRPYAMHEERRDDGERWQAYIRGLFEISRPEHEANAALVPVEEPRLLVDVAGGHGAFSMAMCRPPPVAYGNRPRPSAERGGRPPDRGGAGLQRAHLVPRGRCVRARPRRR